MGYQRGSDEINRSRSAYDPETVRLIQASSARQMDQSRELSNLYSSGIAEEGQHLGGMIGSAAGQFGQGMKMRQGYEQHGADMRQADQLSEEQGYRNQVAKIGSGRAARQDAYGQQGNQGQQAGGGGDARMAAQSNQSSGGANLGGGAPVSKTREQMEWDLPLSQANDQHAQSQQNLQLGNAQIASIHSTEQRQKVQDMAVMYADAYRDDDPASQSQKLAQVDAMAKQFGVNSQYQPLARPTGSALKKSVDHTQNTLYNFSPEGVEFGRGLAEVNADNRTVKLANDALARLKNAPPMSSDADKAAGDAIQLLRSRNVSIDERFGSDVGRIGMGGHESREEIIEKAIAMLQKQAATNASFIRSSSPRLSQEAQSRLGAAEQSAPTPSPFNDWSGQGGQNNSGSSAIQNVLNKNKEKGRLPFGGFGS